MTAGSLQLPAFVDHRIMWLEGVSLPPDRSASFGYFLPTVSVEIFCIPVMVPVGPSIEQFLPAPFLAIPYVYVLRVIELLQNPVVAAFLLKDPWMRPVQGVEVPHHIRIIDMALSDIKEPAPFFCFRPAGDTDLHLRIALFHLLVHRPPDSGHKGRTLEALKLWFPVVELPARLMVLRCMAFVADRCKISHAVRTSLAPVNDMMHMQDHLVRKGIPAALARMMIPCEYRFPERSDPVAFPFLVICPLRKWCSR